MRLVDRLPVHLAQPIADRPHAPPLRSLPSHGADPTASAYGSGDGRDRRGGAASRRRQRLLPAGAGRGNADRLLPRQSDPRRGLAAVSSSAAAPRSRSTCPAGDAPTDPTRLASTTRCTGSRPSSNAVSTSSASAARKLVVHDWGCAGADRRPAPPGAGREAGGRSTRCRCCPATAGTGSPRSGAAAGLGELANATTTKASMGLIMRQVSGDRRPMPPEFIDMIWDHLGPRAPARPRSPSTATPTPTASLVAGRDLGRHHLPRPGPLGRPTTPTSSPASPRHTPTALPDARAGARSPAPATGPGSTTPGDRPRFATFSADPSVRSPVNGANYNWLSRVSCPRRASAPSCPKAGATPAASSGSWSWSTSPTSSSAASPTGQRSEAIAHGQQVIDFERSTHTFFEPSLQAFFLPAHWVIDLANQLYLNAQFSIALGFLVWLYLFRNESYYFVRNMFVVSMGLALIGYTLFPTAPPRMFPQRRLRRHDHRLLQRQPRLVAGRRSSSTPTRRCRACTAPSR